MSLLVKLEASMHVLAQVLQVSQWLNGANKPGMPIMTSHWLILLFLQCNVLAAEYKCLPRDCILI